jgi:hypothetical protein
MPKYPTMSTTQKYDKSRWMVARERFRITDKRPPRGESEWSIKGAVTQLFKTLDERKSPLILQIQAKWSIIAGDQVARHSRPAHLDDNILYVYVDSSSWLNEIMRFYAADIRQRIQKEFGAPDIKQVRYQVNPGQARQDAG